MKNGTQDTMDLFYYIVNNSVSFCSVVEPMKLSTVGETYDHSESFSPDL